MLITSILVSCVQAAALLLFNASDRLSYSEIMTQLNLTDDDVIRLLHSLSCAKYKILNKEPNTKTISSTDVFEFNNKFNDKMRRIKIPLPPVDEKKKVIEDVDKDRRYAIDASIVRIMKSRKVLGHQQLVMECVEQLGRMFKVLGKDEEADLLDRKGGRRVALLCASEGDFGVMPMGAGEEHVPVRKPVHHLHGSSLFLIEVVIIISLDIVDLSVLKTINLYPIHSKDRSACSEVMNLNLLSITTEVLLLPDFKAIKKRIEDLITRDYLERDKDNPNIFRYLA
ncbi:hypothetical protein ZIOFF_069837 [Zingiber officinale]|uniref:Cullin family profile domain-containing protein n=1 Tax=Zingiber officinale TaxID=94328 RepID=A0A8J5CC88_ZINOF|nr:hypothetical protein ZIOFF_069837 [Zingiber officinale]